MVLARSLPRSMTEGNPLCLVIGLTIGVKQVGRMDATPSAQ